MVCSEPLQLALTATSSFIFRPKIFHSLFNSTPNSRKLTSFMLLKYLGDSIQSGGNQSSNSVPRFSKFVYRKKKRRVLRVSVFPNIHIFSPLLATLRPKARQLDYKQPIRILTPTNCFTSSFDGLSPCWLINSRNCCTVSFGGRFNFMSTKVFESLNIFAI